jgi:hypothetical protein
MSGFVNTPVPLQGCFDDRQARRERRADAGFAPVPMRAAALFLP